MATHLRGLPSRLVSINVLYPIGHRFPAPTSFKPAVIGWVAPVTRPRFQYPILIGLRNVGLTLSCGLPTLIRSGLIGGWRTAFLRGIRGADWVTRGAELFLYAPCIGVRVWLLRSLDLIGWRSARSQRHCRDNKVPGICIQEGFPAPCVAKGRITLSFPGKEESSGSAITAAPYLNCAAFLLESACCKMRRINN